MRILALLALLPILAGCLPSAGPKTATIVSDAQQASPPFAVVPLNQGIADLVSARNAQSFDRSFGTGGGAPTLTLGVGDMVAITIYEAASGGLFSGEPGSGGGSSKNVTLPPQPITRNGTLSVPYVGQVRAAGSTAAEVQRAIELALKDKAIEPQVILTVTQSPSTFVTVAGDVRTPGRLPLSIGGDRILDVIASSGGSTEADYNTFVRLTRGSQTATVSLARIVRDNSQNIYVRPRDVIYVYTDAQIYTAFGATLRNDSLPFTSDRLTLAEAVGQAGGLNDNRADARGVFVFRYEAAEVYSQVQAMSVVPLGSPPMTEAGVPVVYKLNFRDPSGFFAAQRFLMRDNDVLYVSNAESTDIQKLLGVFTPSLGSANNAALLTSRLSGN